MSNDLAGIRQVPIELVVRDRGRFAPCSERLRVPATPDNLAAGDEIVASNRDLPLTGPVGCGDRVRMRTVVGIRDATLLPGERTVVAPEKRGVVPSRRIRRDGLLPWEDLENVGRVVDRERVVPDEHAACSAVAREVQSETRARSRNGDLRRRACAACRTGTGESEVAGRAKRAGGLAARSR